MPETKENRYARLIEHIFFSRNFGNFTKGVEKIGFARRDLELAAEDLNITLPKNLGDVVYSTRYRRQMPHRIVETQPEGKEWIIEGDGRARYKFMLVEINRIIPNPNLAEIKIPDATPEIIGKYALNDEQALLAKVRYNRLIDIFLGLAAFSLQNHMRTTVPKIGQIETDEIYVGIDRDGAHYVIPVEAKGGKDQLAAVQTKQDLACCADKFPDLICRPVSAQFMSDERIAMFELGVVGERVVVIEEKHYVLVSAQEISPEDLLIYKRNRFRK